MPAVDPAGASARVTNPGDRGIPNARTPWSDSRFWLLQLVVLALALVRLAVTVGFGLEPGNLVLEVSTIAVFAVPVVYASLAYGLVGGLATVTWVTLLSIPRFAEESGTGVGAARWAEAIQIAVLATLAVLVGRRVSSESASRVEAQAALEARIDAELLYQEMFESNRSPILIVDADGFVTGSNASAQQAFRVPPGHGVPVGGGVDPSARRLVDVIGPDAAALVLTRLIAVDDRESEGVTRPGPITLGDDADVEERVPPVPVEIDGHALLFRPTATRVGGKGTGRRMQVIFEDVTAETRRHDLMEAFAGQVVSGQEEERRHIAQELHDGPLQALIHLCRQIDSVEAGPGGGGVDGSSLASMRTTVEDTVAELRSIARGLRPSVLDDLGLVASINQLLTEAAGREGFDSRFEVRGAERRLPPAVELALFRIAQEAITNAVRHARADQVAVTVEFAVDGIGLRVEDDGVGFDRSRHQREDDGQSLGLPGMSERARLIGGRLRLNSQVGDGTVVEAWVPEEALDG